MERETTIYKGLKITPKEIIKVAVHALEEQGYDAVAQLSGYLISGDPTYITQYDDARNLIRLYERDELLEMLIEYFLDKEEI